MTTGNRRGLYLEDLKIGDTFLSGYHVVTAEQIKNFALLMGETNPLHIDETFAAQSPFGCLTASGSFGLTLAISLLEEAEVFHGTAVAALGIEGWHYRKPIVAGLKCRSRMTINDLRARANNADTGVVDRYFELLDADDTIIQSGLAPLLVKSRPL
jgi:acyl dehydratase